MSTLDENGLVISKFSDIEAEIQSTQRSEISSALTYTDSNIVHQQNSIVAGQISELQELIEAVYNAKRLSTATAIDLDYLGVLKRVFRLNESRSFTPSQQFVSSPGTTIPTSSLFSNPITNERFTNITAINLSNTSCLEAVLSVQTLSNNTVYTITVEDTIYSFSSSASATQEEITAGLAAEIEGDVLATFSAAATGTGASARLTITTDDDNSISVVVTTFINIEQITAQGRLESVVPGRIVAPPATITNIISTIPGLISTTNPSQYNLGRLVETDEDYRRRIAAGRGTSGLGTPPAIEAYLLANVEGIGSATVIENELNVVDAGGRPPKSYEVIVTGASDEDIAEAIWISHGAGIQLYGTGSAVYTDPRGRPHTVSFSRPAAVNIAVRVTYTTHNEGVFPPNGENLMTVAVINHITSLPSDQDVITGRMFGPLYGATDGLDTLVVEIQTLANSGDTPIPANWSTDTIAISDNEFASTADVDVFIVEST